MSRVVRLHSLSGPDVLRLEEREIPDPGAGDAVGVLPGFDPSKYGTYADHAIIPQAYVLPQPPGLTNIQAAGLWMTYLTAYGGLIEAGRLLAGDWVVIP